MAIKRHVIQRTPKKAGELKIEQPHNAMYKDIFSVKEILKDLLNGFVPHTMLGGFSYKSLERMPQDFISSVLEERRNDLLWRVRAGSTHWNYILILNEFQSTKDKIMPVRLLEYEGIILHALFKGGYLKPGDPLPYFIVIVVYNGAAEWDCPLSLAEMRGKTVPSDLEKLQAQLEYLIIDIKHNQYEAYKDKKNLSALFFRLDAAKDLDVLSEAYNDLSARIQGDKYQHLRELIRVILLASILPRLGVDAEEFTHIQTFEGVGDVLNESMNEWKQKYIDQGLHQGMQATHKDVWDEATRVANEAAAKDQQRLTQDFEGKIQDTQSKMQNFKSKIQNFLQEKGYSPEEIAALMV